MRKPLKIAIVLLTTITITKANVNTVNNQNGIKTSNLKIHHNYSKVNYQQKVDEIPSQSPIYNGHSYGQPTSQQSTANGANTNVQNEKLITYYRVINGTVVGETRRDPSAPTVIIRRKKKQSPDIEQYTKCPPGETGQFVYELSCNQFLNCWKGRGYPQNCAPGTLFNPKTLECDFPEKVECVSGPRGNAPAGPIRSENLKQATCPPQFSGIIPDYFDCAKFINCANGVEYRMDCPPGTLFDVRRNLCDFPRNCQCFNQGTNQNQASGQSTNQGQGWSGNSHQAISQNQGSGHWATSNQGGSQTTNQNQGWGHTTNQGQSPDQNQHGWQHPGGNQGTNQNQAWGHTTNQGQSSGQEPDQTLTGNDQNQQSWQHSVGNLGTNQNQQSGGSDTHQGQVTSHGQNWQQSGGNQGTNQNGQWGQSTNQHQAGTNHAQSQGSGHWVTHNQGVSGQPTNQNQGWEQTANQGHSTGVTGVDQNQHSWQQSGGNQGTNQNGQWGQSSNQHQVWTQGHNQDSGQWTGNNQGTSSQTANQNNQWGQSTQSTNQNQQTTGQDNGEARCPQGGVGLYPHPHDCAKFLNCANGITYVQDCGPGTVFNPLSQVCDYPYNVKCASGLSTNQNQAGTNGVQNQGSGQWSTHNQGGSGSQATNQNQGWGQNSNQHQGQNQNSGQWNQETTNQNQVEWGQNQNVATTTKTVSIGEWQQNRYPSSTSNYPQVNSNDYDDIVGSSSGKYVVVIATTPRTDAVKQPSWPPPFPSTDTNADYVFEYEDVDDEITLQAENSVNVNRVSCNDRNVFRCNNDRCIDKTSVCDNVKHCPDGSDEISCAPNLGKFNWTENAKLAVLEKERWDNVTIATCAYLCLDSTKFPCRSFNYRKIDKTCFLSDTNVGLTGALISYYPCDHYEMITEMIDCTDRFLCATSKCIDRSQICDGFNDCGDRQDETDCDPKKFAYTIKLTGSDRKNEGLVEITAFGRLGHICDDKFGITDATVACKELGFPLGAAQVLPSRSQTRNATYLMDDVSCVGNETSLSNCPFAGWGNHDCRENEAVAIVCKTHESRNECPDSYWACAKAKECLPLAFVCDGLLDCTDGSDETPENCDSPTQLRLVNGTNHREGRLEIRHNGVWGTICDDDFNEDAAKVACKNLGFYGSALVKKDAHFGPGNGPIWLDQVTCYGNETALEKCVRWDWGEHNCDHSEDVAIVCADSIQIEKHLGNGNQQTHSPLLGLPKKCGFTRDDILANDDSLIRARMVNAPVAKKGDHPWQASIRIKGLKKSAHWCGAVIITPNFVLTAAHCVVGYPKSAYVIAAGDFDFDSIEGGEQEAHVDDYYIHPNFREGHRMNNDLAVVKLKGTGFQFTDDVRPICLPPEDADYSRSLNCTISGFGSVENGKSAYSHRLRSGRVPLVPRDVCKMPHVYGGALTDGMFCAGYLKGGVDSCDGDSGGPLDCLHDGVHTLYGLTSWGQRCGEANKPGVYVRVAHYRKWIDEILERHSST